MVIEFTGTVRAQAVYYKCSSNSWNPPRRRRTVKKSAAVANFGWRSGAPHFFRRRRRKYVSGWRGGGIRRLTGQLDLHFDLEDIT